MPINSRRYSLWTRLYKRMLLEPTSADNVTPRVSEVVVPVIQADEILQTPSSTGSVSKDLSGSGFVPYWTVPKEEEWLLSVIARPATSGSCQIVIKIAGEETPLTPNAADVSIEQPRHVLMRDGDQLGMSGSGNGGDTSRAMRLFYFESDIAR